jgi:hypothetical protein
MANSHWKQPRCPTIDEWIKKLSYLYTMEFYSAIMKNDILSFAGKWMELENIILSEVSQVQKAKGCMFFSHVEYRPNKNTSDIMKNSLSSRSHMKGGVVKEGS